MATRLKKGSKAARDYMAKIRGMKKSAPKKKAAPRKKPRTVGKATGQPSLFDRMNNDYQTGTSNKEYDRKRVALPPGVRKSKATGNKYTERRANRSDRGNSLLGIGDFFDTKVITDLDNLKKEYKKLAMKYHPDKGGTTAQMQSINSEYDKLRDKLLKGSNLTEDQRKNEIVIDDAIRDIIDVLILVPGINIELIGKWIWVSGQTYAVKSELSAAGLEFIRKAGSPYWVYKGVESKSRGGTPMDEIKKKYGVHKFDNKPPKNISGIPFVRISLSNRAKLKRSLKKLVLAVNKRPI
jgi:hypothetical protein